MKNKKKLLLCIIPIICLLVLVGNIIMVTLPVLYGMKYSYPGKTDECRFNVEKTFYSNYKLVTYSKRTYFDGTYQKNYVHLLYGFKNGNILYSDVNYADKEYVEDISLIEHYELKRYNIFKFDGYVCKGGICLQAFFVLIYLSSIISEFLIIYLPKRKKQ